MKWSLLSQNYSRLFISTNISSDEVFFVERNLPAIVIIFLLIESTPTYTQTGLPLFSKSQLQQYIHLDIHQLTGRTFFITWQYLRKDPRGENGLGRVATRL